MCFSAINKTIMGLNGTMFLEQSVVVKMYVPGQNKPHMGHTEVAKVTKNPQNFLHWCQEMEAGIIPYLHCPMEIYYNPQK
jgi:hypothetical protein